MLCDDPEMYCRGSVEVVLCIKLALKLEFAESEPEHTCLRLVVSWLYGDNTVTDINEWNLNLQIDPKLGNDYH